MRNRPIARMCVFCGSNHGADPRYSQAAQALGATLAEAGIALVYGGGRVGLMGVIADAVLERGGEVIGVIPHSLNTRELAHEGVTEMHRVATMHERKALMADLSDGFVALPGGFGTFDEFFEIVTWAQLGIHHKPCGLLNVAGYYDRLIEFLDSAVAARFVKQAHRDLILVDTDHARLLEKLRVYESPVVEKWITGEDR